MNDVSPIFDAFSNYLSGGCRLFEPYDKQKMFFELGATHDVRCFSGANRVGKTMAFGGGELGYHLTGEYPSWWKGKVFNKPVTAWVGSTDWSTNIEGVQMRLVGDVSKGEMGQSVYDATTGQFNAVGIPADCILGVTKQANVPNALASVIVKHVSGGKSRVRFYAYSKGRENLQAGKADIVWMDEESPLDICTELMARTMDSRGITVLTFTPLKGVSDVVQRFIGAVTVNKDFPEVLESDLGALVRVRASDAPHLGPDIIAKMRREYPKHEHMARIEGIPALGEGAVFPFDDESLTTPFIHPDNIPGHWYVHDAIDLGINHPTTRARVYMDPDREAFLVAQVYKVSDATTKVHATNWAEEFKGKVSVGWPHDGRNRSEGLDPDTLTSVADKYRALKVDLLPDPVCMPSGDRLSSEGAVNIMYEAMAHGRFKVFPHCTEFFSEKALYRRERKGNGPSRLVGTNDDVIHAVRNAILGLLAGDGVMVAGAFHVDWKDKRRRVIRDDDPYEDSDVDDDENVDFKP